MEISFTSSIFQRSTFLVLLQEKWRFLSELLMTRLPNSGVHTDQPLIKGLKEMH